MALAFSGSGFMMGPATGRCLVELTVYGEARYADIDAMRPSRFAEGKPNHIPTEDEWLYHTKIDRRFS